MIHGKFNKRYRPNGNCVKCGIYRESLHKDHIIPKFKGGPDNKDNIQFICANCHEDKTKEDLKGAEFAKINIRKAHEALRGKAQTENQKTNARIGFSEARKLKWPGGRPASCHPDRLYYCKNLCRLCYKKSKYIPHGRPLEAV